MNFPSMRERRQSDTKFWGWCTCRTPGPRKAPQVAIQAKRKQRKKDTEAQEEAVDTCAKSCGRLPCSTQRKSSSMKPPSANSASPSGTTEFCSLLPLRFLEQPGGLRVALQVSGALHLRPQITFNLNPDFQKKENRKKKKTCFFFFRFAHRIKGRSCLTKIGRADRLAHDHFHRSEKRSLFRHLQSLLHALTPSIRPHTLLCCLPFEVASW